MKRTPLLIAAVVGTFAGSAPAQTGGAWDLSWNTVDCGGGQSNAGPWSIHATFAQPDAGPVLSGAGWSLALGFWGSDARPACVADVDDGTFSGVPDGGVTIDDLLYYLTVFDAGLPRADIDDGSGTGTPDGGVTIDDLLYFLLRFDAGC